MKRITAIFTGTAIVAVLGFQQLEIQTIGNDTAEIKDALRFIVQQNDPIAFTAADEQCLAKNIYHEAGIEDNNGKFAVAQVTLNRLRTGKWGSSLCDVVYAKAQFSWTLFKKRKNEQPKGALWDESKAVAHAVLFKSYRVPSLKNATYYHADYVQPAWRKTVVKIQQIGQHIFYEKA